MLFNQPLQPATLLRRYKRFLADVELPDGQQLTVHCPNTGSMMGCGDPGLPVMISRADNPKRKYPHTLEMVQVNGNWVGINTSRTNGLVREALERSIFPELGTFDQIKPEVKTGNSRLDFLLTDKEQKTYVEVKNCTLARGETALFPDAVTTRGNQTSGRAAKPPPGRPPGSDYFLRPNGKCYMFCPSCRHRSRVRRNPFHGRGGRRACHGLQSRGSARRNRRYRTTAGYNLNTQRFENRLVLLWYDYPEQ